MKHVTLLAPAAILALAIAVVGCNTSTPVSTTTSTPAEQDEHAGHDHGDHAQQGSAGGQTDMEQMKSELAKLSLEDAASAEKQHFCPVSGEMLGTMGAPKKVDVKGQQVWICCDSCRESLLKEPDDYLAKLNQG